MEKKMKKCSKCASMAHKSAEHGKKKKEKGKGKIKKVMGEFKKGELHSGSKKGPVVTNPKQAIAIAISEKKRGKKK
jgi:hypothetical protein